jgi:hypothetical protein
MSLKSQIQNEKKISIQNHKQLDDKVLDMSKIIIKYSAIVKRGRSSSLNMMEWGSEHIKFHKRNPIYRAFFRIEFEDAMKNYHRVKKRNGLFKS